MQNKDFDLVTYAASAGTITHNDAVSTSGAPDPREYTQVYNRAQYRADRPRSERKGGYLRSLQGARG